MATTTTKRYEEKLTDDQVRAIADDLEPRHAIALAAALQDTEDDLKPHVRHRENLRLILTRYLDGHRNEPLEAEGLRGRLMMVPRGAGAEWDLRRLYDEHPERLFELLEKGALTVNDSVAAPLLRAGALDGLQEYRRRLTREELRWV